jgi:hypothetical protein
MPKLGEVNINYPALLETENKIRLLEPFKGAKKHHVMQCLACNNVWSATPISKRQTLKKFGVGGCPLCNETKKQQIYKEHRTKVVEELWERGVEILDKDYDGRLRLDYSGRLGDEKILVRNRFCGHMFDVTPLNLIQSKISCSTCGIKYRISNATAWSKANSAKWQLTATAWQKYKSRVSALTEQNYEKYRSQINPNNLPRGLAGIDGAYHLDHIIPKRWCFDNQIPAEICAHPDNLQLLQWFDNVSQRNHLKEQPIPKIFRDYITETDY